MKRNTLLRVVKTSILFFLLICVVFVRHLYMEDSRSLSLLRGVLAELETYCSVHHHYPTREEFVFLLEKAGVKDKEFWQLFIGKNPQQASLQYPMSLPILWAPGKARTYEFLPVIYAFIIGDPCQIAQK